MKIFEAYKGLRKEMYVLFFSKVITSIGSMVWTMMTFILSDKLMMSASEISLWFAANSIVQIPVNLLGGRLADKVDKKFIICLTDLIEVILYFYCFFVPLTKTSIIVFLACSLLENLSSSSYSTLVCDLSSSSERDRANSLLYFGTNLGMMVAPIMAGFLVTNYTNYLFLANGSATLIALVLEVIYLKDITPTQTTSEYEQTQEGVSIFTIIKNNLPVAFFCLIISFQWLTYSEYSFFVPLDLSNVYGDDGSIIYGFLSTINCITVVLFTANLTNITRKMKELTKYVLALIFFVAGYVIFVCFINNQWICYLSFFIFTIGEILATIVCDPFISRRIPSSHRGRVFSTYAVLNSLVYVLFQSPLANVYDNYGSKTAWTIILLVLIILMICSLLLIKFDKKRYPKIYEAGYLDNEDNN